ncbi:MAG: crossover junction endodeoxyribonuclease RuvC [Candidatus Eisenbacteria bacterium]
MLILGLDPGSRCTGYGLIDAGCGYLRWRASGMLRPPREQPLHERLLHMHSGLRDLVRQMRPAAVALEDSFVGRHSRSALILGQARGALVVAALSEGAPLFEYAPRLVKLAVTGTGAASKEQVRSMIGRLLEDVPGDLPLDVTDALALAICHANRCAAPPRVLWEAPRAPGREAGGAR